MRNQPTGITPAFWKDQGNRLISEGKHTDALHCYDQALALDPKFKQAWLNKGLCLRTLQRDHEAYDAFTMAIEIDPAYAKAVYGKVQILLAINKNDLAMQWLDRYFCHANGGLARIETTGNPEMLALRKKVGLAHLAELTGQTRIATTPDLVIHAKRYLQEGNIKLAKDYFDAAAAVGTFFERMDVTRDRVLICCHHSYPGLLPDKLIAHMIEGTSPEDEKLEVEAAFREIARQQNVQTVMGSKR